MSRSLRTYALTALLAVLGVASASPLAAQATGTVRGRVTDAKTQRALSGAQVSLVGTTRRAVTGTNGEYSLANVPTGTARVRAELIGYTPADRTVTVAAGQTADANLSLSESAVALDALVVTATGEQRAREVGTSGARITARDIEVAPVTNAQEAIAGRATGVTVIANSGAPGTGGTIRLRGNNSISQGNEPLIYVDGVRIYNKPGPAAWASHQGVLPLNDINADDIARVEIVKGAAATTLYGTEASGGVIQIFTKRGAEGKPEWSTEATYGVNNLGHVGPAGDPTGLYLNQCRGDRLFGIETNPRAKNAGQPIPFEDTTCPASGTWLKNGPIQRYSLSVRGGAQAMKYFLSGNYSDENGVIALGQLPAERGEVEDAGWSKNGGFRGNFTFSPARGLDFALSTSYNRRVTNWVPDGNNASGFLLNVTRGLSNNFKIGGEPANGYILEQRNFNRNDHFITGFTVTYAPGERLSNRVAFGYDYNNADNETLYPFGYLRVRQGLMFTQAWNHTTLSADYVGTFKNNFGESLTSSFSWGGQLFQDRDHLRLTDAYDFAGPGTPTLTSAARKEVDVDDRLRVITAGVFLEEQLGYLDRLFVTLGLRVDGNSAFGQDFGLQPYPKVNAAYVLSDHDFWPAWWESLKLRAAVGESGKAPGAFDAVRTWGPIAGDDATPGVTPLQVGNANLGPERTREYEVGFEASAFDGRLGLDLTAFRQNTYDALVPVTLPPSQGFLRRQLQNVGELQNTGLEVALDAGLVRSSRVDWGARVNFTRIESEAIDLGENPEVTLSWANAIRVGRPVPSFFGQRILNPNDVADPLVSDTAEYIGPSYPTRIIGLGTNLTLMRRLTLDMLGEFQGGHFQNNWVGYQNARRGVWQTCYDTQQKLVAAANGDASALNGVTAQERAKCAIDRRVMNSDFWIQPADFFKLRSASLTYQLPSGWVPGGVRNASVTLAGRNLWKSTDYDGIDPESNERGDFLRRVEYYNIPPLRTFLLSMRMSF
jgi:TonB-linked SusC/RagA family outer membrane protein